MTVGMSWSGPEVAAEAEAAGIGSFCTGDFADHDAYLMLAEMAAGTTTAEVGTAITYAFSRTPYAHATAARQIHRRSGGRMFLGFGTGARRINADWFGVPADRPLGRIRELVQAVKAFLAAENGERVTYEGTYYHVDADIRAPVLGRLEIPLLVAAFNKGMAEVSGQVADGLIGHGLFTRRWWDDVVRPAAARGRGDRPGKAREVGWLITAVNDDDPDRAREDARRMIAFYLTVKTYDPYVEHHQWWHEVDRIRNAFHARDPVAMANAVTDEMLDAIAVCGTLAEARQMLDARAGALATDTAFLAAPSYLVSRRRQQAYARAALGLLA
jgi:alkanesulfonate monooxygenase SsuD/methylene tetrahydromethanopterin reductase-like flavin-dependent oxidoreductase (luciferase family)